MGGTVAVGVRAFVGTVGGGSPWQAFSGWDGGSWEAVGVRGGPFFGGGDRSRGWRESVAGLFWVGRWLSEVRGRPFLGGTAVPGRWWESAAILFGDGDRSGGWRESVPLWGRWEAVGVRWLSGVRAFVGTATRLGDTGAVGLRTSGEWL